MLSYLGYRFETSNLFFSKSPAPAGASSKAATPGNTYGATRRQMSKLLQFAIENGP